jgi:hypothetical protein
MNGRSVLLATLVLVLAVPAAADTARVQGHTKRQAEVNVLRTVSRKWRKRPLPGIVDPRTHLLLDNTEAVCRGVGGGRQRRRYARFTCVVRPHHHRKRQGLYVSYRTRSDGAFTISWIVFRRR